VKDTFLIVILVTALSGCAAMLDPEMYQRCSSIAGDLSKTPEWVDDCTLDISVYNQGLGQLARKSTPKEVCEAEQESRLLGQPAAEILLQVSKDRKINCKPYRTAHAKEIVQKSSVNEICVSWSSGVFDKETETVIRDTVKRRKLDCNAIISNLSQQQYQQQQLQLQRRQISMQQQNLEDQRRIQTRIRSIPPQLIYVPTTIPNTTYSAAPYKPYTPPKSKLSTTNCYKTGSGMTCIEK
jgi:hypothetical protein